MFDDSFSDDLSVAAARAADRARLQGSSEFQPVGLLALIPATLADLGAAEVLASCGISADSLDDIEGVLPYARAGELFDACAAATNCPHFGLLVGQKADLGHFGPLGEAARNAATLEQALGDLAAHPYRNDQSGMFYVLPDDETFALCHAVILAGAPRWAPFFKDMALASVCQIARDLTGVEPFEVHLARRAPSDPAVYARHFRAPVRFDSERSALVYARSDLTVAIPGADPELRAAALWRLEQLANATAPGVLSRTRRAIVPLLQSKTLSLSGVAEMLSMQPRTLNRRLAPEGASFQGEVERLRCEVSRQLLANTDLPISQIAYALGYSAISAFSRSFRRWTGKTPGEWRETL